MAHLALDFGAGSSMFKSWPGQILFLCVLEKSIQPYLLLSTQEYKWVLPVITGEPVIDQPEGVTILVVYATETRISSSSVDPYWLGQKSSVI
jgi:hypothetical protein